MVPVSFQVCRPYVYSVFLHFYVDLLVLFLQLVVKYAGCFGFVVLSDEVLYVCVWVGCFCFVVSPWVCFAGLHLVFVLLESLCLSVSCLLFALVSE